MQVVRGDHSAAAPKTELTQLPLRITAAVFCVRDTEQGERSGEREILGKSEWKTYLKGGVEVGKKKIPCSGELELCEQTFGFHRSAIDLLKREATKLAECHLPRSGAASGGLRGGWGWRQSCRRWRREGGGGAVGGGGLSDKSIYILPCFICSHGLRSRLSPIRACLPVKPSVTKENSHSLRWDCSRG